MKYMILAAATAALVLAGPARAGDDTTKPAPAAPASPDAPGVAAKHENKIAPEAKAAFEKMEKISNNPVKQGLKDASGTISMDMMGSVMSMKFTFKAPSQIHVEADPNAEGPAKMMGPRMTGSMERMLRPMLGIFRPGEEEEYDASFATKDGKGVISITSYKDGAAIVHTDFTLDDNGLPATCTSKTQMEMKGQKHEMTNETTFTWEKSGDLYRMAKMKSSMSGGGGGPPGGGRGGGGGMGGGGGKVVFTYTYTDVEKFAIATSWKMEVPGGMSFESRMSDLTVNGKKIDIKAPEGGDKAGPKKGEGDDEGGEKEGK